MSRPTESDLAASCNHARYRPDDKGGHYESWFQRANHPTRPLAFWIRYTIFVPKGRPDAALGELWAIWFDGESGDHVAVRQPVPAARCAFARDRFAVRIERAELDGGGLRGDARANDHHVAWDLRYASDEAPLFDLRAARYNSGFPKAKALVGAPLARYTGHIIVDGQEHDIDGWVGSQNHNWGSQHTDHYAWGQVAGFDGAPGTFLEVASARLRLGPVWSPFLTLAVLRHDGHEYRLNALPRAIKRVDLDGFDWRFEARAGGVALEGHIAVEPSRVVCLPYLNPPGGEKHCLNSKLARCTLRLRPAKGAAWITLETADRAAFEILTDERDHGLAPAFAV